MCNLQLRDELPLGTVLPPTLAVGLAVLTETGACLRQ